MKEAEHFSAFGFFRQNMADEVGFEPTSPVRDYRISSAGRYDHFDTHPYIIIRRTRNKTVAEC